VIPLKKKYNAFLEGIGSEVIEYGENEIFKKVVIIEFTDNLLILKIF